MLGPLVAQMSTQRSGSLAATRVVSRKPLATRRRSAAGDSTWATAPIRAVAASWGRWLAKRGHLVVQLRVEHQRPPAEVADERGQPPQGLVVDVRRRSQHPGRAVEQVDPGGAAPLAPRTRPWGARGSPGARLVDER
jgi:hypothetical protein